MLRFSANLSMLFQELPFLDRFDAAAKYGFRAVEFWFPYDHDRQEVASRLKANGLQCVVINTPAGDVKAGDWGTACDPSRIAVCRDDILRAIDYACAINANAVHMMAGILHAETDYEGAWSTYLSNLSYAAEQAQKAGKKVLVEALNEFDRPGYIVSRQLHVRTAIASIKAPNVQIMFDVYHTQRSEGRVIENLAASESLCGHIQVADVPGRHEPGTGELNWARILGAIEASGYEGWIGCEYMPAKSTVEGIGWINNLVPVIGECK